MNTESCFPLLFRSLQRRPCLEFVSASFRGTPSEPENSLRVAVETFHECIYDCPSPRLLKTPECSNSALTLEKKGTAPRGS